MSDKPAGSRPHFRGSKFNQPRLAPDEAARQGSAARQAFSAFGDRERAMAFLNSHDEELGGRPIDVAIASGSGLAAVEQAIGRALARSGTMSLDGASTPAPRSDPVSND